MLSHGTLSLLTATDRHSSINGLKAIDTVGRTYQEMWLKTLHGLNAGTYFADALRETALS